ncbi:MAG: sulfite exporter TauE/SafE family protein, partial [Micavibrio aeruginosavorus]|nr:sulfite exporter TauE/SafE family protein [Micavibrio aeruginosavorus]
RLVFAVSLLALAAIMALDPQRFRLADTLPSQPWPGFAGGFIGLLSTLMGIGGATISVPYMTLYRVPIHQAVGTASALGLIISVPAAFGFILIGWGKDSLPPFSFGYINLLAAAMIVPFSVLAAPWGAHTAHRVSVDTLRRVFAVFLMIVSLRMLYDVAYG